MDENNGEPSFLSGQAEPDYQQQLIEWALTYNAYDRLGSGEWEPWGGILLVVLRPLLEAFREEGAVPTWAGIDLLRGWAFWLVRINRHEDGYLLGEHPEMLAIADAITNHPAARESDLPPQRPEDYSEWDYRSWS